MVTVRVSAGAGYDVMIGDGVLGGLADLLREHCPAAAYAVISDDTVGAAHGRTLTAGLEQAGLRATLLTFPAGEASKTRDTWASLTDRMLDLRLGRDAAVIALGGGVAGDVAGFVAATYLRGIPYVQVPTTLLAMIDSSIGGKTGVDVPAGKNLVGAFHQPRAVVADVRTLRTLSARERILGMAEAIKHGVIADAEYFALVERSTARAAIAAGEPADLVERVIAGSVLIKASVVSADEREQGRRAILNFGHTIGHALEAASGFRLPHGEAVAMGMVAEARLAEQLGVAEGGTAERIRGVVSAYTLPAAPPAVDGVLTAMRHDKKVRNGTLRFALPVRIGAMAGAGDGTWTVAVPETAVRDVL